MQKAKLPIVELSPSFTTEKLTDHEHSCLKLVKDESAGFTDDEIDTGAMFIGDDGTVIQFNIDFTNVDSEQIAIAKSLSKLLLETDLRTLQSFAKMWEGSPNNTQIRLHTAILAFLKPHLKTRI